MTLRWNDAPSRVPMLLQIFEDTRNDTSKQIMPQRFRPSKAKDHTFPFYYPHLQCLHQAGGFAAIGVAFGSFRLSSDPTENSM